VLTYDLRNQGGTSKFPDEYPYDCHLEDLEGLITALGLESVILVGYSSGSSIAVDYALRHPYRAKCLILGAPLINPYSNFKVRLLHKSLLNALQTGGLEGLFTSSYPLIYGSEFCEKNKRSYIAFRERFLSMFDLRYLSVQMKVWLQSKVSPDKLEMLKIPVFVIVGDEDPLNPVGLARRMSGEFGNIHVKVIDNCGHTIHIEKPDEYLGALQQALACCGGGELTWR
jgi:pimeloyl-ACP methyl ester carboxylesterase